MINLIPGLQSTTAALSAERVRLDVVGQNIANINTTRGIDGKPYQRQQVMFESVLLDQMRPGNSAPAQSVQVTKIINDTRPPKAVHMPGHPDADANGMVLMPDMNVAMEMVDMMTASRAYEANLAVMKVGKNMAMQTLGIGKRM